jgi:hypothetical protein
LIIHYRAMLGEALPYNCLLRGWLSLLSPSTFITSYPRTYSPVAQRHLTKTTHSRASKLTSHLSVSTLKPNSMSQNSPVSAFAMQELIAARIETLMRKPYFLPQDLPLLSDKATRILDHYIEENDIKTEESGRAGYRFVPEGAIRLVTNNPSSGELLPKRVNSTDSIMFLGFSEEAANEIFYEYRRIQNDSTITPSGYGQGVFWFARRYPPAKASQQPDTIGPELHSPTADMLADLCAALGMSGDTVDVVASQIKKGSLYLHRAQPAVDLADWFVAFLTRRWRTVRSIDGKILWAHSRRWELEQAERPSRALIGGN